IQSKGVLINVTSKYPVTLIGDVVPVNVEVANLREDTIYSVNVTVLNGISSKNYIKIPTIKLEESAKANFDLCFRNSGIKNVKIEVSYEDEFNNLYREEKLVTIRVLNETALQFSGIDVKTDLEGLTVTGDVSNNGRSKVYNIFVTALTANQVKTYYIDCLDPSDFDTFEFTFTNYSNKVTLKVKWTNEIGEVFETTKMVTIPSHEIQIKPVSGVDYVTVGTTLAVLIFVVLLIVLAWKRRK
ncbi:hypothetical protein, partial [Archaeoglobus sp.]